jgi:hypothetical protein
VNRKLVVAAVAMLVAALAVAPGATAAARDNSPLFFFEDGTHAGGQSSLVRNGELGMVSAHIKASHLTPGNAYTYWWVVFNDPSQCNGPDGDPEGAPECGENDIFDFDVENDGVPFDLAQITAARIVVLGGNGEIANNGGHATFTGALFEDSSLGHDVLLGPGGVFDFGNEWFLEDAMTAEIHIVARNHGPAQSGADLAEQLHIFGGNCTPASSGGAGTGAFVCVDEQFAVHK